jgi:hypothetical protein
MLEPSSRQTVEPASCSQLIQLGRPAATVHGGLRRLASQGPINLSSISRGTLMANSGECGWSRSKYGPCHGGMSHTPLPSDSPFCALTLGGPLASDTPLQLAQLGLAAHVNPTLAGSCSAVVGTLHDPLALVLRQGALSARKAYAPLVN